MLVGWDNNVLLEMGHGRCRVGGEGGRGVGAEEVGKGTCGLAAKELHVRRSNHYRYAANRYSTLVETF